MNITWNTGSAAERFRHNLRLKKNKKKKRAPSPKLQARKFWTPTKSYDKR